MRKKNDPRLDEKRLSRLLKMLSKPQTVAHLCARLKISRATLYRDLARLNERGHNVRRYGISRPTKYFILTGESLKSLSF